MLQILKNSQTSIVVRVKLRSALNGQGLTGLTFSSSGLVVGTIAGNEATTTAYTAAGSTIETIATLGTFAAPTATKCRFREVDAVNHPGLYELQIADARWAVASAKSLIVTVSGATNLIECDALVPLWSVDPFDAVRFGQAALPNAAAEAAGGLYTRGSGAGQINQPAPGMVDANVVRNAGTAITAASGVQEVKVASIAAAAITAASIAADAITDAKVAADVTIASVTGAVGSVTGNVGGNVTGSVGSVATGGIAAASFAAGAIDAAAIATDALGALELAAGAASEIATAVRTELATELGRVDVAVSTRLSTAGYTAPDNADIVAIKAKTDNLPTDPADASDVAASFSSVASTLATIASYVDTEVAAIKAKTDNLPASPAATGDAMTLTGAYDAAKTAATQTSVAALGSPMQAGAHVQLATAQDQYAPSKAGDAMALTAGERTTITAAIAGQVTTDHGAGSYQRNTEPLDAAATRAALGLATASLDTQLSGIPAAVRINLATELSRMDVAISTRLAASGYTAPANATIAAIAAEVALESSVQAVAAAIAALTIPTTTQIADGLLARNIAGGANGGHTLSSALKMIRNRVVFNDDGTFDVYEQDGTTIAFSGTFARAKKDALVETHPA